MTLSRTMLLITKLICLYNIILNCSQELVWKLFLEHGVQLFYQRILSYSPTASQPRHMLQKPDTPHRHWQRQNRPRQPFTRNCWGDSEVRGWAGQPFLLEGVAKKDFTGPKLIFLWYFFHICALMEMNQMRGYSSWYWTWISVRLIEHEKKEWRRWIWFLFITWLSLSSFI